MTAHTLLTATAGGLVIGASALALLALNGRIAGISGIAGGLLVPRPGEWAWRALFTLGLLVGGAVCVRLLPGAFEMRGAPGDGPLVAAGVLVGLGTRLANGCTSGHGVCGLARRSPRSLAATATFMGVAAAVVFVTRHVLGGGR